MVKKVTKLWIYVIKGHKLVINRHKTVNFGYIMSQTYDINHTARQKLVDLNYQINKVVVKIKKSMYLGQDSGDVLQPDH